MIKKYYEIHFKNVSAMNIGSGSKNNSDRDVLKDSDGNPFVQGSALTGAYRDMFSTLDADKYFGNVVINKTPGAVAPPPIESVVRVYDAFLEEDIKAIVKKRDCVGLDEYKTAVKGAKFDFEVVEPGTVFRTFIEQYMDDNHAMDIGAEIINQWQLNGLSLGSKTMRGLGKTQLCEVYTKSFDLAKKDELDQWLSFDMYSNLKSPQNAVNISATQQNGEGALVLKLKLRKDSGISIREYSTEVGTKNDPQPDYSQLTTIDNGEKKPLIPGTSWTGAFKHHMASLLSSCAPTDLDSWFGKLGDRSKIAFSENTIDFAKPKEQTRNAVDRFTGGTVTGALYTEKYYFDGETGLTITVPRTTDKTDLRACSLVASVFDLHFGLMAVGGLTSVGRGMFEIEKATFEGQELPIPTLDTAANCYSTWIETIVTEECTNGEG